MKQIPRLWSSSRAKPSHAICNFSMICLWEVRAEVSTTLRPDISLLIETIAKLVLLSACALQAVETMYCAQAMRVTSVGNTQTGFPFVATRTNVFCGTQWYFRGATHWTPVLSWASSHIWCSKVYLSIVRMVWCVMYLASLASPASPLYHLPALSVCFLEAEAPPVWELQVPAGLKIIIKLYVFTVDTPAAPAVINIL